MRSRRGIARVWVDPSGGWRRPRVHDRWVSRPSTLWRCPIFPELYLASREPDPADPRTPQACLPWSLRLRLLGSRTQAIASTLDHRALEGLTRRWRAKGHSSKENHGVTCWSIRWFSCDFSYGTVKLWNWIIFLRASIHSIWQIMWLRLFPN